MNKKKPLFLKIIIWPVSMVLVWMLIVPVIFTDIMCEIYHRLCFPLLGIPYVDRSKYIRVMDRFRLPYLNILEKFGCAYCGYMNGWVHYASKIAAETEKYFCAIRHKNESNYIPNSHEQDFVEYGDKQEFQKRFKMTEERK